MPNERPGPIFEWFRVEISLDGYWIRVLPGARAFSLPEVIAYLLALAIPGIDFQAVKAAYDAADGTRAPISTVRHGAAAAGTTVPPRTPAGAAPAIPPRAAPPPPPTETGGVLIEERGEDIFLTVPSGAGTPALREVLASLSRFEASRLDLGLIRSVLRSSRGTPTKISRQAPREVPRETVRPRAGRQAADGILLACGEDHLRDRLSETLKTRGLTVFAASTAAEAMEETLKRMPDLLLVTHPLGDDDGLAFVRQAHSHARIRRTPAILIPENPTREVVSGAIQAGASDLLVRPVTPGALIKKVGRALETIGKTLPPEAKPTPDVDTPAVAAEDELKSAGKVDLVKLAKRVDKLLALPAVVQRVMSITSDARTGARELGLAIGSDAAVTATVLRKANSAYFGKKGQIADIAEGVVRLGFIQTRSLVVGMSMIHLFTKGQRSVGFNRGEFWRHSMATAILAKLLAERAGYPAPDLAFIAGLLHDVGKMLLDEYYSAEYELAALRALKDLLPMRQAERQVLETDHTEVGAAILELWKFPAAITAAVGSHHDLEAMAAEKDPAQQKLDRLVYVSNYLAKAAGEGNGGDQIILEAPRDLWDSMGLWEGLGPEFWKTFQNELDRTQEFLDLGETREVRSVTEPRRAVFLEEGGGGIMLSVLLSRSGWTPMPVRTAAEAAHFAPDTADVLVLRAASTQGLVDLCQSLRAAGSALPIVAVLPPGQVAPARVAGFECVVEPYDRLALLQALPV